MSKTAVSELNARMSIDISQMEQAVPRAIGHLKRLGGAIQAEALASQMSGPDAKAVSERIKAAAKSPGVIGLEGGGRARFKNREDELQFVEDISAANDESLRRRAAREAAIRAQQKNAVDANLAEIKLVDDAMAATAERQAARDRERMEYEQMLADRRAASAKAQIEFADAQRDIVSKSARDSAAVFIAEQRNADERLATEQRIADVRRRQAQVRAASEFDRANPFQQQVLAVQELNRLIGVQRNLRRAGVATDEQRLALAEAELAVTRQIAAVRDLRETLTAGTNLSRLGNTAEDSQARFARFGLAMQQTGYQVQDFAVQVASGTKPLVAFSQQASQLLGFFGGYRGAIAGAVLSVGILGYRLYEMRQGTEAAKKSLETLADAVKKYREGSVERSRLNFTQPELVEALKQDLAIARKTKDDALKAVNDARNKINEKDLQQFSSFPENKTNLLGENLVYLTKYLTLYSLGATNAQIGTTGFEEASKDLSSALNAQTDAQNSLTKAQNDYNKQLQDAKVQNSRIGETQYESLVRLREEYLRLKKLANDPLKIELALGEFKTVSEAYNKSLTDVRKSIREVGESEYDTVTRLESEYANLLKTSKDTLVVETALLEAKKARQAYTDKLTQVTKDTSVIGEDEFTKYKRLQKEFQTAKANNKDPLGIAQAENAFKTAEEALKNRASGYKDQLDSLRAQKRELELIKNLENEKLLTPQESNLLQLRMADERARQLKLPEMFKAETGASFAGLRNTDGTASQIVATQQQMLAELRKLVWQGSN